MRVMYWDRSVGVPLSTLFDEACRELETRKHNSGRISVTEHGDTRSEVSASSLVGEELETHCIIKKLKKRSQDTSVSVGKGPLVVHFPMISDKTVLIDVDNEVAVQSEQDLTSTLTDLDFQSVSTITFKGWLVDAADNLNIRIVRCLTNDVVRGVGVEVIFHGSSDLKKCAAVLSDGADLVRQSLTHLQSDKLLSVSVPLAEFKLGPSFSPRHAALQYVLLSQKMMTNGKQ